jgi:CubicO group peptidase (beta-lactamase class C family)
MNTSIEDRLGSLGDRRPPGIAVAIVCPERVQLSFGVGQANLADGIAASPRMVCPWFSMTKIVTATTAMRLVGQGRLDLDEPLGRHSPQLGRLRPAANAKRITARHLLTHSAGLANPIPVKWIHRTDAPAVDQDALLDGLLAKNATLRFEPGAKSSYSNLGTLSLGVAMANITGIPFPELVQGEVLKPLQMHTTGFSYTNQLSDRAATGYHPRRSPMRFLLPRWVIGTPSGRWVSLKPFVLDGQAYGGLLGSLEDAARFLRMHLRDGELDGAEILAPDTARRMRDIVVPGRRFDLGLGWFRPANHRRDDPPFVEHLGGGAGFFNLLRIYPTRGIGIVVMGNATRYDIDAVAELALMEGARRLAVQQIRLPSG